MSLHRAVVPFRVDFSGDGVCSGLPVKLGYLKESNVAAHSVTAPAWNIWAIDCDILILKLVIHFLAVSPPVVELLNEEKSSLLKLVEEFKQTKIVKHANFINATV